ncbi:hypothetical protein KC363_g211 [Hortaea werneckii]|nr:hypothetical protein KC363_g211 [Hortaea werneckii]
MTGAPGLATGISEDSVSASQPHFTSISKNWSPRGCKVSRGSILYIHLVCNGPAIALRLICVISMFRIFFSSECVSLSPAALFRRSVPYIHLTPATQLRQCVSHFYSHPSKKTLTIPVVGPELFLSAFSSTVLAYIFSSRFQTPIQTGTQLRIQPFTYRTSASVHIHPL